MSNEEKAKELIAKISYITIASVSNDGLPWNTPVFAAYDNTYNFYWGTYRNSQKAKNIRDNRNVFLVIYDTNDYPGKGFGVYIKASAEELTDVKDVETAHKLLWDRHIVPYWKLEEVQGDSPIRLYKAIPEKVWVNGEGHEKGHYIDTRVEIKL